MMFVVIWVITHNALVQNAEIRGFRLMSVSRERATVAINMQKQAVGITIVTSRADVVPSI